MGGRVWGQSVQFSRSVVSNSLRPHELQHARTPCPSPTPESTQTYVHWVSDTIQPSHPLSSPSPVLSLSQHQGLFKWVSFSHQWGRMDTWICMPEFLHYSPEITSLIDCTQIQNKKVKKKKEKKARLHFTNKGPSSQSYDFPSSHVWMSELDQREGWVPKNWCFQIVVLEKTLLRFPWTTKRSNLSILK